MPFTYLKKIIKNKNTLMPLIVVFITILIAFLWAAIPLPKQLFFYFDQARDAFSAYNIWHNFHLPILGPTSDIPGVFHGVLWYYFLAIPYALGNNNPYFTGYFLLILLFLSLPLCGYLAYKLFNNLNIALISIILYVFSPLFQISTRWLSNPSLSLLIVPVLLIFLWKYINNQNNRNAIALGLSFGLLIQSNFAFVFFLLLLPIYWLVFRLKFKIAEVIFFTIGSLLILSSFIIAEVKFHERGIIALINYFKNSHSSNLSIIHFAGLTINKFIEFFSVSLLPFSENLILIILFVGFIVILIRIVLKLTVINWKPVIFLLIWLLNIALFELFNAGISTSTHVFLPSLLPLIILGSYFLYTVISRKIIVLFIVFVLILSQIALNLFWIKDTVTPLSVQKGITYSNELKIVDYTYKAARGENFTINTITVPLYINTTWAYLYQFYGENKYKYIPYWGGRDQNGYLGSLPLTNKPTNIRYLIIEPTTGIPDFFVNEAINAENTKSTLVNTLKVGNFIIEKRNLK